MEELHGEEERKERGSLVSRRTLAEERATMMTTSVIVVRTSDKTRRRPRKEAEGGVQKMRKERIKSCGLSLFRTVCIGPICAFRLGLMYS